MPRVDFFIRRSKRLSRSRRFLRRALFYKKSQFEDWRRGFSSRRLIGTFFHDLVDHALFKTKEAQRLGSSSHGAGSAYCKTNAPCCESRAT